MYQLLFQTLELCRRVLEGTSTETCVELDVGEGNRKDDACLIALEEVGECSHSFIRWGNSGGKILEKINCSNRDELFLNAYYVKQIHLVCDRVF